MTERGKHLEEVLRECAELGVPDPGDPWPAIKERVSERPGRHTRTGYRRGRRFRLLPRTRAGWVLAGLLVMLFGTAAYATSVLTGERSDLIIEEAALRSGENGGEIVVRARVTGKANLPDCLLLEGEGAARTVSSWYDEDLTESYDVGDTTTYVFHERSDAAGRPTDARKTPLFASCSAGTEPGSTGPGVRSDTAHVAGTAAAEAKPEKRDFVRKDMASPPAIRPPKATLSYEGRSVEGSLEPYCWSPGSKGEEENVLWCWDEPEEADQVPSKDDALRVPAGSTMVLDFGGKARRDSVVAGAYPLFYGKVTGRAAKDVRVPPGNDRIEIPADTPTGDYVVGVGVSGPEGQAGYSFRVIVEDEAEGRG